METRNYGGITEYEKNLLTTLLERYPDDQEVKELVNRYSLEREVGIEEGIEIRRCDVCGKPMIEGFVMGGCEHACSEECFIKSYGDIPREEAEALYAEDMADADGDGESYYTEWESYRLDY